MAKSGFLKGVKSIILLGYIAILSLAIYGIVKIYQEFRHFTQTEIESKNSKELKLISNTLLTLYETENRRNILLSENFHSSETLNSYSNIDKKLHLYLDSLYLISNDTLLHLDLDTVNILLDRKYENMNSMLNLMAAIKGLPYSNVMKTSVVSKKSANDLSEIIKKTTQQINDTTMFIKEKKSFFGKLISVFSNKDDSIKVVSKSRSVNLTDTTYEEPIQIITDTIVEYINNINAESDKKKVAYVAKLSKKHAEVLNYDQLLTQQVKDILRKIEKKEQLKIKSLSEAKQETLNNSSRIVSLIALISILSLMIFIILSFRRLNKSQKYKVQLEESNKYAEFLAKSREKLLLMISHDIKAPLSSIIGHIELLSDDKKSKEDKLSLDNMRSSSEQILDLSNKLLEYHKLEKGDSPLQLVAFEPHRLLEDINNSFLPLAQKKDLYLNNHNQIVKDAVYTSDPFILKQIFNNLINNGIKFTDKGGLDITSKIVKNNLIVSVKDTGVGIDEEDKEQIFSEFHRANSIEKQRNVDGHGLGLSITLKLIHLLKGNIDLESEVNKGSTFTVEIPLESAIKTTEVGATDEQKQIDSNQLIGKKVLFVDDDITMLNVYSKIIEKAGAEVTTCNEPIEALKIIKSNSFDIIFTDIQMPIMNGFELVNKIREIGNIYIKIPIIGLSARSEISLSRLEKTGFTRFMIKPVNIQQLVSIIADSGKGVLVEVKTDENVISADVNLEALIEFIKDDRETSLEIMQTFFDDNKQKLKEFKKGLKNGDDKQIQSIAHKALPLMRMIKATNLIPLLEEMEVGSVEKEKVEEVISLFKTKNREIENYIASHFSDLL